MSTESQATTVEQALGAVEAWRADEDARRLSELGEVAQEMQSLEAAMENLRQQLAALSTFSAELEAKGADLSAVALQRTYQSVFEVLQLQAAAVEQREREGVEAAKARRESLPELLSKAGLASVLAEYEQFKTAVLPTLQHLPESYRAALLDVHEGQEAKLRSAIGEISASAPGLSATEIAIDLVYGIDAPDGNPELVVVVVPVSDNVHAGWIERDEGLQTILAARVAQAVYQAALDVNFVAAQALSGGHLGLLAVELELVAADPKIVEALRKRMAEIVKAPEFAAAKVALTVREVSMDFLLPPEEDAEAEDGE